ncbi:enoyl-CoA hydratase/isomerase family protein [Prauserella cavernicola]|uniref:Enoyl-CoA hydratase/isomerase family protein n=1 Tax=Prauserella cavernicola TaxID=2800127 RepID=A0A934QVZ7_9PSEU|nr:enoyl-CoA hydratase/isomerase family protein [Prauserella cavernicola]MBK1787551.1 enoyl-CoA hydratase/isomerase family protein [Prauserella cavernicola]
MTTRWTGPAASLRYSTLRAEQDGRVLTVSVTDPPYNYMTAAMQDDVIRLVDAVETDPGVGAVVVTGGVPGRFVTHYDITDLLGAAERSPNLPSAVTSALVRATTLLARAGGDRVGAAIRRTSLGDLYRLARFHHALERILRSPAVWIGAIDGPCGGGGLEMSAFFDLRFCSETATFLLPELSIGLSTTFGGQRLARLVGPSRALEVMLESRAYSASEAREYGLADGVVPGGELTEHVHERATRYARRPREVVAVQKRIFHDVDRDTAARGLLRESIAQSIGLGRMRTRAALRRWLRLQDASGDSTFLTDPRPWAEGTAADLVGS